MIHASRHVVFEMIHKESYSINQHLVILNQNWCAPIRYFVGIHALSHAWYHFSQCEANDYLFYGNDWMKIHFLNQHLVVLNQNWIVPTQYMFLLKNRSWSLQSINQWNHSFKNVYNNRSCMVEPLSTNETILPNLISNDHLFFDCDWMNIHSFTPAFFSWTKFVYILIFSSDDF